MTQRHFIDADQILVCTEVEGKSPTSIEVPIQTAYTLKDAVDIFFSTAEPDKAYRLNPKTSSADDITEDLVEEYIDQMLYQGYGPKDRVFDFDIIPEDYIEERARELFDPAGSDVGMSVEERNPGLAKSHYGRW